MAAENVLAIGASRNIGYHAAIRLLGKLSTELSESGSTVTFLLRSPSVFDKDEVIQGYVKSGKVRLLKGDGLVKEDVQRAWDDAGKEKPVDTVLFTVGRKPLFFHLFKGFLIDPPNLVAQCLLNVLITMPKPSEPRMIVVTSAGLTPTAHRSLPFLLRLMYTYILCQPHKDKVAVERLVWHCAGKEWPTDIPDPGEELLGSDWAKLEGLPEYGTFTNTLTVRPYLLTDGDCVADKSKAKAQSEEKKPYRVGGDELSGYTISRKDVAHFIVEDGLKNWDQYRNRAVTLVY
ncbi:hypothetical protein M378DRAFT_74281 [Amanita muscaria Koide BX008]|uniref:NAD(P)-binding domain-containing protein n=1 Tax=Amanita muscaria (strain Koide BX008) TaxID=946122 RepID=A0A0C2WZ74_AMAMK|nr:hypothetical protein M378DRAFT_74281 [Amanita muscaria Koide BX008]